jgi:hypothetical protein
LKQDPENSIYTISSLPKEPNDSARIVFNLFRVNKQGELIVQLNNHIILVDLDGREEDSTVLEQSALNLKQFDNCFFFWVLAADKKDFVGQLL